LLPVGERTVVEQYNRQVAFKLKIQEIIEGNYQIEEGWAPNYLLTKTGQKVSRVNLMGIVLGKELNGQVTNLLIDDGSGKIMLRSFEEIKNLGEVNIGEGVMIIGKIRIYNEEKYVSPEIVKKVDNMWLKLRKQELVKKLKRQELRENEVINEEKIKETKIEKKIKKTTDEELFAGSEEEGILETIRRLDKGEGALIEEVAAETKLDNREEMIDKMLEKGEISQNLPGRVKVL